MPRPSTPLPNVLVRLLLGAIVLGGLAACGSSTSTNPLSTPKPVTTHKLTAPPAELGNGLVCGAAADRVLNIADGIDLKQFTEGTERPRSATIQHALSQYLAGDSATKQRAAGLIVGQCAAYGFYIITYQECIGAASRTPLPGAVRACIDRRTWTVYTQQ